MAEQEIAPQALSSTSPSGAVLLDLTDGVATVTLNRPEAMNALDIATKNDLLATLAQVAQDPAVRCVVLTGVGRAFCVGQDLREHIDLLSNSDQSLWSTVPEHYNPIVELLCTMNKPVVAAITGYALGGGMEVALAADFRVAGERARLGQPEILLGVIPGAGGTQRLPRLIGPAKAKDLVFSGRLVNADEALRIGLVDQVVPDADVYSAAVGMVQRYASGPALALRAAKQAIDTGLGVDLATGLEIERVQFAALFGTEDQRVGMRSFLEKGPGQATFTGH